MKAKIVVVTIMVGTSGLGEVLAGPGRPSLRLDPTRVDVGPVTQGQPIDQVVTVTNRGDATLSVTDLVPACDCTLVTSGKLTVAPGKRSTFSIRIDTTRLAGEIRKTIKVESDDPARPIVSVAILADVVPKFVLSPRVVDFGAFQAGAELRADVIIRADPGLLTGLKVSETTDRRLNAIILGRRGIPADAAVLRLVFRDDAGHGPLVANVVLRAEGVEKGVVVLPVRGYGAQ